MATDWKALTSAALRTAGNVISPQEQPPPPPPPPPPSSTWKTWAIPAGIGLGFVGVLMLIFRGGKKKR